MNKHIVKHIVQTGKTFMELKPRDHAPQTKLYLHVASAKPNAQLDAHAPLISLDNSALHTPVPATGMRGAWTAIHLTHSSQKKQNIRRGIASPTVIMDPHAQVGQRPRSTTAVARGQRKCREAQESMHT